MLFVPTVYLILKLKGVKKNTNPTSNVLLTFAIQTRYELISTSNIGFIIKWSEYITDNSLK